MGSVKKKISPVGILFLGFLILILLGAVLLSLPVAIKDGNTYNFIDTLFVATSASCVTGLVPFEVVSHYTLFGQIVIICLIQIGGLGFMAFVSLFLLLFKRKMGLRQQTILMASESSYNIGEAVPLLKTIFLGSLTVELLGAILLSIGFYPDFGTKGIYMGVFHSISAFCNAGFDILGSAGGSLTAYSSNPLIMITVMLLILLGGLGFIVWSDVITSRMHFKKFHMHTKLVLIWTVLLVLIPALLFFVFEFTDLGHSGSFTELSFKEKVLNSFFLAISPRTAGFASLDLSNLTASGKLLTMVLMFIGGNTGSTAGGFKVTTLIVVLGNLVASAKGNSTVRFGKQGVPDKTVKQAGALFLSYVSIIFFAVLLISFVEPFTLEEILFEVISAIATVGLTLGITGNLTAFTKVILTMLMYIGRIGAFALFNLILKKNNASALKVPDGKILVG